MSNGDFWPQQTWMMFNGNPNAAPPRAGLLTTTMGPMQVAQKVFPTVLTGNDNPIPATPFRPDPASQPLALPEPLPPSESLSSWLPCKSRTLR